MTSLLNGVEVSKLMARIEGVRKNPAEGAFTFRVSSRWEGGLKARHTVGDLRLGSEQKHHAARHELTTDLPDCLAGEDTSMGPIEMLIASLSACLLTGYVAHGAAMNIKIQELTVEIRGEGDIAGFFGIGTSKAGLTNVSVKTIVKSNAPTERLQDLHHFVTTHSPVWDTFTNRVQMESKLITDADDYGAVSL
jgi:uncharacterized OsmC-like protein